MTKNEFISRIAAGLSSLPPAEIHRTISYFDEMIQDRMEEGTPEEEAVRSIGDPDVIASEILSETGEMKTREDAPEIVTARKRRTYETDGAELSSIRAVDGDTKIEVIPSEDGRVRIHHTVLPRLDYIFKQGNGVLSVTKRDQRRWYERMRPSLLSGADHLVIEVPRASSLSLFLKTSNSTITVRDISAGELTGVTGNGRFLFERVTSGGKIDLKTTNGPVTVTECTAGGTLSCLTANGRVMFSSAVAEKISAGTTNAPMIFDRVTSDGAFTAETSNGKIVAETVKAGDALSLHSSNGSIRFSGLRFEKTLEAVTSNGTIEGVLSGSAKDYSYHCHTTNGKCTLPEEMKIGEKEVRLRTSNGSICVTFEES